MTERYVVLMEEVGPRGAAIGPFFLPDAEHGLPWVFPSWEAAQALADDYPPDQYAIQVIRLQDG